MFITGIQNDKVYQYNLTTAFDVSTASYSNNSIDLGTVANGSQTDPRAIIFNNDGTKMFTLDSQGDSDVNEFTLSTAFDLSSTVTFVDSFSISSQTTKSRDLVFNDDGTKMFVYDNETTPKVSQYNLSTAYDVSTASYSNNYTISGTVGDRGIAFSIDGKKMFINDMDGVFEYTLSTGFDLSSTITQIGTFNIGGQDTSNCTMTFNNDGTKMFFVGHTGNDVNEYTLTTPFSLTNISGEHDGDVLLDDTGSSLTVTQIAVTGSSNSAVASGSSYNSSGTSKTGTYGTLRIGADGSYDYVADQSVTDNLDAGDIVPDSFTYTVSNGSSTDTETLIITVVGVNDTPVADSETGSVNASQTLTVTDSSSDLLDGDTDADTSASLSVSSIVATTAGGSATAVNPGTTYNSGYTSVTGSYGTLRVGADGTYQYIAGSSAGTDVFTYTLFDGTATDTETLTITVNAVPVAAANTGTVKEDATLTVTNGATSNSIAGASFVDSFSTSGQIATPVGLSFNNDGTKMFVSGSTGQGVAEYTLSTAFDVSTASHVDTLDVSSAETLPKGHAFNNDGTIMYVVGLTGKDVTFYMLSTGFDVSTATHINNFSVASQETAPMGITFNNDGTKMFIVGHSGAAVNEYTLSSAFNIMTASYDSNFSVASQELYPCLLYTSPSPRDKRQSRMPSSA